MTLPLAFLALAVLLLLLLVPALLSRARALARLRGAEEALEQARRTLEARDQELRQLLEGQARLREERAALESALVLERHALEQERQRFQEGRAQLRQDFELLAGRILEESRLSLERRSQEGLGALLVPLREQLESFRTRVDQVHSESLQGHAGLRGEMERLRELNQRITDEAAQLTRALRGDKKLQGSWGEQKLELLLEMAGLRKGVEYERELVQRDEEGALLRPDVVVKLPGGRHLLIDSKVSLVDYATAVAAEDPAERQRHLAAHVAALRGRIRELGQRRYHQLPGLGSPDFTILFVAVEPAWLAAAEHSPALVQEAFEQGVALATASTLLPVLRVAAELWSLQRRGESARELAALAGRIHDKLRVFLERMEKLGLQLDGAQRTWKEGMGTLREGRGNLLGLADRFAELGVRVERRLGGEEEEEEEDEDEDEEGEEGKEGKHREG